MTLNCKGSNLLTCTSENTFLTFLWFPFVRKCPGCAILTEKPFWKPIFPTHQCNGQFSPFLCWAPRASWLHSEYTIFYWDTCSIEWATTENFFERKIVEFLKKAVWQTFLQTAIRLVSVLLVLLPLRTWDSDQCLTENKKDQYKLPDVSYCSSCPYVP